MGSNENRKLMYMSNGTGLTVVDRNSSKGGEYEMVAQIMPDRSVSFTTDLAAKYADQIRYQALVAEDVSNDPPFKSLFTAEKMPSTGTFPDMFNRFDSLSPAIQKLVMKLEPENLLLYTEHEELRCELETHGYTYDYDTVDGRPIHLRKMSVAKAGAVEKMPDIIKSFTPKDASHNFKLIKSRLMNISPEVMQLSRFLNLDHISTGGGNDFVYFNVGGNKPDTPNFIISGAKHGLGPKSLDEPAEITYYPNLDWEEGLTLHFETTKDALTALASQDFRSAVIWEGLGQIEQPGVMPDEIIDQYVKYSDPIKKQTEALDLTQSQVAELVISTFNGVHISELTQTQSYFPQL